MGCIIHIQCFRFGNDIVRQNRSHHSGISYHHTYFASQAGAILRLLEDPISVSRRVILIIVLNAQRRLKQVQLLLHALSLLSYQPESTLNTTYDLVYLLLLFSRERVDEGSGWVTNIPSLNLRSTASIWIVAIVKRLLSGLG